MSFIEAIKTCFTKYVDFNGRARRSEYWFFVLFNAIVSGVFSALYNATDATVFSVLSLLFSLAVLLPGLAVTVRRLHDIGKKWTFILLGLIPIAGAIILIVNCAKDSQPGANEYGPNPKEM